MILPRIPKALDMNFHSLRAAIPQDDDAEEIDTFPPPTPSGEIPGYTSSDTTTSQDSVTAENSPMLEEEPSTSKLWDLPNTSPKTSMTIEIIVLFLSVSILLLGGFYLRRAYRRRKLRRMLRDDMYDLGDDDLPTKRPGLERKSSLASPLRKTRRSEKAVRWGSEDSWKAEGEAEKGEPVSESEDETLGRGYGMRRC